MAYTKPRPSIEHDIAPFWDAVQEHRFVLCRCQNCGEWYFPVASCQRCELEPFGENMRWEEASGKGTVFVFNIHKIAFDASFNDDLPYVFALIELDEGPMFGTNIVDCAPEDVAIGQRVEIFFRDFEDDVTLPLARLID
jgi:uncharacterized OB-fold protein